MSHYTTVKVNFTDAAALKEALIACGYHESQIEVHKKATEVRNFCSYPEFSKETDPRFVKGDKAHVIIRSADVGHLCGDVAFFIEDSGNSVAFICDESVKPERCKNQKIKELGGHGTKFLGTLAKEYSKKKILDAAKKKNKRTQVQEMSDGCLKIFVGI